MGDLFDHLIRFILAHNEAVVQWMFLLVVATGAILLGTSIFSRPPKDDDGASAGGASAGAMGAASMSAPEVAIMAAEVAKLKLEVEQRTNELTAVKAQASQSDGNKADTSKLEERIKELEGKLVEYEILEDDIADLSLYKEENARLKAELTRLGGTPSATAPSEGTPQIEAKETAPESLGEDLDAELIAAAESAEESTMPKGLSGVEPPPKTNGDLVEEFATVVEESKRAAEGGPEIESDVDVDDLLTEFATSLGEELPKVAPPKAAAPLQAAAPAPEPPAVEEPSLDEQLDTDKMLAEAAALEEQGDTDPGLDEETDMEKMAAEASKLLGN